MAHSRTNSVLVYVRMYQWLREES